MVLSKSSFALMVVAAVFVMTLAVAVVMYNSPTASDGQVSLEPSSGLMASPISPQEAPRTVQASVSPPSSPLPSPAPQGVRQQVGAPASDVAPLPTTSETVGETGEPAPASDASASSPARPEVTTTPVAEALAPLGEKFVTAFHFVASTDTWVYYDPLFPEEGMLKAMVSGQEYLILVTESITVEVSGQRLELVCNNNDCWNTVVWP